MMEEIVEGVEFVNCYGVKIYVMINIIVYDENIEGLELYLCNLEKIGVIGIIVVDFLIIEICKEVVLKFEIYLFI